jgi:hypothetical protein
VLAHALRKMKISTWTCYVVVAQRHACISIRSELVQERSQRNGDLRTRCPSRFLRRLLHQSNYGVVRVSDFRQDPGKKVWSWGTARNGRIWDDAAIPDGLGNVDPTLAITSRRLWLRWSQVQRISYLRVAMERAMLSRTRLQFPSLRKRNL